jgi:hypothetical protein
LTRGIPFLVNIEFGWELFVQQSRRCRLSGLPIGFGTRIGETTASLDRIDSSKPYEPGNVQWLHKRLNVMKREIPQQEFIELCHLVAGLH